MNKEALSLLDLNTLVKQGLSACLPDSYWIQAELSDVRSNANGHCYLEFIQKDNHSGRLLAKARGIIWANLFNILKPFFEESTGESFRSGLKVLVEVEVSFHELYGYSLTVLNIDPTYTLGDMVKRRAEIIKQLEEEGVLTLNKELHLPLLTQRIAVISSATAAGYDDFCHQLLNNESGIPFYIELFPSIMQGEQVEKSILGALDSILNRSHDFDVVVIIRGGGATSDLSGFDTYLLAAACAQFPIPIITGIGHERDDTVLDAVSHTRVKTPTAAAEFLVNRVGDVLYRLEHATSRLKQSVSRKLEEEQKKIENAKVRIPSIIQHRISESKFRIKQVQFIINGGIQTYLNEHKHRLQSLALKVKGASPYEILKKGYALVEHKGQTIGSVNQLKAGDQIQIRLSDGELLSEIKSIEQGDGKE